MESQQKGMQNLPQYWINFLRRIFLGNMVKHREVIHNVFLKQKFFLIILTLKKELTEKYCSQQIPYGIW